ncbi:MAG: hypothetical protein JO036_05625 [Candidatus Eremiobacteraeota bacterium]|nr:hypothetical protein [Candidatus Eremiobacteraeota bacterium]
MGRGDAIHALAGVAIVVVFLALAGLMIARKIPALLAVPLMALATAALAGVPLVHVPLPSDDPKVAHDLPSVIVQGAVKLAPVYATLFFGALLSRVVLSTGIAETLVTYAAEFGGDRPLVLSLLLCLVVAVLFTTVTGLGAIIMIGTIVLPVMMTVGVPRATSATLFLMAFGLGYILNIAQWKFYSTLFGVDRTTFQSYAFAIFAVQAVVLVAYALVRARATRDYATSVVPGEAPRKRADVLALITPVLPLVLLRGFGVDAIVGFALASVYGVLVTRPRAAVQTLVAAWIRGIEDVAPATILMIGIGMLLVAANTPQVQGAVTPLVAAAAPRSPLAYVVLFGLLSPLALYRGPLNPYGVGIGVYTVLATLHVLPAVALVAAVMAVVQVQNVCDPTNTQNVWVANYAGVGVDDITKATLPYQIVVATLATLAVVVFGPRLLGTAAFAFIAPAAAQTAPAPNGLFAPADAARTIAVADDGSIYGPIAADAVYREISGGWPEVNGIRLASMPADRDCATATYSALAVVGSRVVGRANEETRYLDTSLELRDCAGWPVDQWHDVRADQRLRERWPDTQSGIREAGFAVLFNLRTWMVENPQLADALFGRGVAYVPGSAPTYFYSLSKTVDGQMRAFVRPGGPAYAAGLRTNDIVVKLDGKFWWEYGTFQTQRRAYDGLPHTFEVTRGKLTLTIALGAPFRG